MKNMSTLENNSRFIPAKSHKNVKTLTKMNFINHVNI